MVCLYLWCHANDVADDQLAERLKEVIVFSVSVSGEVFLAFVLMVECEDVFVVVCVVVVCERQIWHVFRAWREIVNMLELRVAESGGCGGNL